MKYIEILRKDLYIRNERIISPSVAYFYSDNHASFIPWPSRSWKGTIINKMWGDYYEKFIQRDIHQFSEKLISWAMVGSFDDGPNPNLPWVLKTYPLMIVFLD